MVSRGLGGQHRSDAVYSVAQTRRGPGLVSLITREECMRCSLRAHIHETAPDVLYGDAGQLWVDGSDDFWVWLLEVWSSEPPRE